MSKNVFGNRLKELREERELSQAKLAKALKTYQKNIAQWEYGAVIPNGETLIQLSIFFDVSTDYLLGLENKIGVREKSYDFTYNHGNTSLSHKEKNKR